jgi:hypothetical protein
LCVVGIDAQRSCKLGDGVGEPAGHLQEGLSQVAVRLGKIWSAA